MLVGVNHILSNYLVYAVVNAKSDSLFFDVHLVIAIVVASQRR